MSMTRPERISATLCFGALAAAGCRSDSPSSGSGEARSSAVAGPRTAIVALHIGRGDSVRVDFVALKDFAFDPAAARTGDADLRVEVAGSLGSIGVGESRLPRLCPCPAVAPHVHGDVEAPHEATVLVKVPYLQGDESLRVVRRAADEASWREVLAADLRGGGGG